MTVKGRRIEIADAGFPCPPYQRTGLIFRDGLQEVSDGSATKPHVGDVKPKATELANANPVHAILLSAG
jgi:hypothetical protein